MELYKDEKWLKQKYKEIGHAKLIGDICNVSGDTIEYWRKKFDIPKNPNRLKHARKIQFDEDFFESINSESKAYWLGFLMADGCIVRTDKNGPYNRIEINLKENDFEHLQKFQTAINSKYEIRIKTVENKKRDFTSIICNLRINSKKMADDLITLGVVPNKTGKELFPEIEYQYARHFIRGFFDGDGSLTNSNSFRIGCSSKELLISFNAYFKEELEIEFAVYEDLNRYAVPFYTIDSNHSAKNKTVLQHLYLNSTIYLNRKHDQITSYCPPIQ